MSNVTHLIGSIAEFNPKRGPAIEPYREATRRAIEVLPVIDENPSFSKGQVSVTGEDYRQGSYQGYRLVHFGGIYNHLLTDFDRLLTKIETMMDRMFWTEAEIFVDGGWEGPSFRLSYKVSGETIEQYLNGTTTDRKFEISLLNHNNSEPRKWDLKPYLGEERASLVNSETQNA